MASYRAKAEEYQTKIGSYQKKINDYKADYETKRSGFKSQLDSYFENIKSVENRQGGKELQRLHNEVTQLFEKYYTTMAGKFVKAERGSSKLRESVGNFQKTDESNANSIQELQQEVENQFKEFYDEGGQIQSKYWGGLDASKNTEEMFLRTKLQALGMAIEEAK